MPTSHLDITTLSLGALDTNCYVVADKKSDEAWIIDPADSGDAISEVILNQGYRLSKIILTHGHFDHVLGLLEVKLNFPEAEIYLHADDLSLLKNAQKSAWHWLKRQVDPVPMPDRFFAEGDVLKLGSTEFVIMHTPGHTPGSVCLYSSVQGLVFSGDTMFAGAIGRTDFSYSDAKKMQTSLTKIKTLPSETRVLSGHGPETSIGEEK